MARVDISVVLTTYNQSIEDTLVSAASVLLQKDINQELIISDDASWDNHFTLIEDFIRKNFPKARYTLLSHATNQKTVLNLYDGIRQAQGKYSKELGAGDLLYDYGTLNSLFDFCETTQAEAGFGREICFSPAATTYTTSHFNAPKNPSLYLPTNAPKKHAMDIVLAADWIPGPVQFFNTKVYADLLNSLSTQYGVLYCEDFVAVLSLFERPFSFLDLPIAWYKWGDGISTTGSVSSRRRMYDDHSSFYRNLAKSPLGENPKFLLTQFLFALRRFAALHTPLASALQAMNANSYGVGEEGPELTPLFHEARELTTNYIGKLK